MNEDPETKNLLSTTAPYYDPVEELANEARNELGAMLKFVKGKWKIGDDEVPMGTAYIAGVDQLVRGWIRFEDKKRAESILRRRKEGALPERDELSYTDKSDWPLDGKGIPRDPWEKQYYLPLLPVDDDGELVTYVTSSVGGRIAVGKLCDVFLSNRRCRPIVALDVSSFKSKDYGDVISPAFKVVEFEQDPAEPEPTGPALASAPAAKIALAKPQSKKAAFGEDLDDSVPF